MSAPDDTLVTPVPGPIQGRRARPSRGAALLVSLAGLLAVVVVLYATGVIGGGGTAGGGTPDNPFPTAVQHVTRQSLTQQTQVSATLTFAGTSSVVVPAGTAPSAVLQAQQALTTSEGMVASDSATLAADSQALTQLQATITAAREKQAVDCAGRNAAQSASAAAGAASGGGAGASPCASDEQALSSDQQSLTQDATKVAGDRAQMSSAQAALAGAHASLSVAEASGAVYGQSSTYTKLPALGQVVRRGQPLYAVSGLPVVLLYGSVAPWRAFGTGMAPGPDVAELNANLDALRYGKGLSGDDFTAATAAAVRAFQSAHRLTPTGELLLGSVVFEPGPVRVTAVTPTVGQTVQAGPVLTVTSTVRQVQIALDAAEQSDVKVGDAVTITLPNNSTTPGHVSSVGTVATTPSNSNQGGGGSSTPTIEVDVAPDDPAATGNLDQVPVNVSITTASVNNVLVAPVDALLALANGGYALEEIASDGSHHLVAVTPGLFDDAAGLVQVSGAGLASGQRVVVPSL